jgi:hypothetical protein
MALWKITPEWKKSTIEVQVWTKQGIPGYIEHTLCWRFGEFIIESEEEPEIDDYTDLLELTEDWSTEDCCSEETDIDVADADLEREIEEFLEENSIFDLEELGWEMEECTICIQSGVRIEKIDDQES